MGQLRVTHVYASPANRARQTAKPTEEATSTPAVVLPWLMEADWLRVQQQDKDYCLWDVFGETVRGGDCAVTTGEWTACKPFDSPEVAQAWAGFVRAADQLMLAHGYQRDGNVFRVVQSPSATTADHADRVALFCHNGTVLWLTAYFLGLPPPLVFSSFFAWPSSVTTFCMEQHSDSVAVPRCIGFADCSHLYAAGLQPVPLGMGPFFGQWLP
jgi:probable phosphoglycerate mutase